MSLEISLQTTGRADLLALGVKTFASLCRSPGRALRLTQTFCLTELSRRI